MRILAWNVQGLGSALTFSSLKTLWHQTLQSILFLCETKNPETRLINKLRKHLGLHNFAFVDPIGRSGGLVMAWKDDLFGVCRFSSPYCIVVDFRDGDGNLFSMFGVYLSPDLNARKEQFLLLSNLCRQLSNPFAFCGDFNSYLLHSEKQSFSSSSSQANIDSFNHFVSDLELADLPPIGPLFTWTNRQKNEVKCRLDRFLLTESWLSSFSDSFVKHLSDLGSDHRAILYNSSPNSVTPQKYFIYDQRWNDSAEVSDIVRNAWTTSQVTGSCLFKLYKKLMVIRHQLVDWQSKGTSNSHTLIAELKLAINREQNSCQLNWESIRSLEADLELALRSKETFWKRKARNNWLLNGDRNTSYFQRIALFKRQHNHIDKLGDSEGTLHSDEESKQAIAISYFQNLFKSDLPLSFFPRHLCPSFRAKISHSDYSKLIRPVSLSEIKTTTFSIGTNQSPGFDGFTSNFFQNYWSLISPELFRAVSSFFSLGVILKNFNHSIISLIPKVNNPSTMSQLRPISLCQVVYKIIAKILASRLSVSLPKIIGIHQNGFIKNRQITGNLIVANEIMHVLRRKKAGNKFYMALKLDMEKAFDRIEWDYLFEALFRMGFHPRFIQWIRSCVTTVSYYVNLNGRRCGFFQPSRGLRQGDPLSPLLFAICSEVLSHLLSTAMETKTLKGIKVGRHAPPTSHLFFADGSFIFVEVNQDAIRTLKDLFLNFQLFSCQKINFGKSAIFFSQNTPPDLQLRFSNALGVQAIGIQHKYLGLPSLIPKYKDMFKTLEDKLRKKNSG
ncbi:LINE-1 retrotransposable element ORF2 protein [Linum grandiflorum]